MTTPPRFAIKHRLSPVRSLGKRRFISDTCRIRVLPWRSERTTFCLCWWFLNCLYKLQVITRLQYDQCTCLCDVSRHHATCCSAALIWSYLHILYHRSCFIHEGFMLPKPLANPFRVQGYELGMFHFIAMEWQKAHEHLNCVYVSVNSDKAQMYVAICTKPQRRYRKLMCVDCCRFSCRSSSHTARW